MEDENETLDKNYLNCSVEKERRKSRRSSCRLLEASVEGNTEFNSEAIPSSSQVVLSTTDQYNCQICFEKCRDFRLLDKHILTSHEIQNLYIRCQLGDLEGAKCTRHFLASKPANLWKHIRFFHAGEDYSVPREKALQSEKQWQCKFCGKFYHNQFHLKGHLEEHRNHPDILICPFTNCSEIFQSNNALWSHNSRRT